jgi:D-3-phosphoglycerate dehydrogenase
MLNGSLVNQISNSVLHNKDFFEKNKESIYIISGGFLDFIYPVTDELKIPRENVFGNRFKIENGNIIGFDENNPLSRSGGKPDVIRNLMLEPKQVKVIGDGYTDYEIKEKGLANEFYLYTENVYRKNLLPLADQVIKDITHLISFL